MNNLRTSLEKKISDSAMDLAEKVKDIERSAVTQALQIEGRIVERMEHVKAENDEKFEAMVAKTAKERSEQNAVNDDLHEHIDQER